MIELSDITISVIIPIYNRSSTVERAIRSVLDQSLGDLELLVIDDGSTDDLAAALDRIDDQRVRTIRHRNNRGAAAARNTGIEAARGRFVAFLDSDDEWSSTAKLERQVEALRTAPLNVSCCYCGYVRDRAWDQDQSVHVGHANAALHQRLLWACELSAGSTLVARRSVFDVVGLFDEDFRRLEDWDWLFRYAQRFEILAIAEPMVSIHSLAPPPAELTGESIRSLAAKHLPRLKKMGRRRTRLFTSTLLMERASIAFHRGRNREACGLVVQSWLAYPIRDRAFYFRMLGLGLRVLGKFRPWRRNFNLLGRTSIRDASVSR